MPASYVVTYLLCLGLAVVIGYAIRKASTCAVGAVIEMFDRRRARRFLSFLLCSAFAAIVLVPASWMVGSHDLLPAYQAHWSSALGGALFGLGAVINGACNFGTIDKLGCGQTRYLFLFPGLFLGAWMGRVVSLPRGSETDSMITMPGPTAVIWLVGCLAVAIILTLGSIQHKRERGTPGQPVAFYMAIIGALGAVVAVLTGHWHYTRIAVMGAGGGEAEAMLRLGGLLIAVIVGAVAAGIRDGRFRLQAAKPADVATTLTGGTLMGFAILLVPGGNDGMVLSGLPALSASALVAYLAMCASIAGAVWVERRVKARVAAGQG